MPQHKRGPWSQTEDSYLVHLVGLHGAANWVRISSALQTRSPKQCRERFHQNLKPNLNHDPISPEEGVLIEQMVGEMGKRWAEIARRLRGRSDNAVKNWWNGGMNRRRRSNHSRRPDADARQSAQMAAPEMPPHPTHHHTLPSSYGQSGPGNQYYGQPMYQHSVPQHINMPPHGHMYRQSSLIESPLPSPSAFSQLSADAPSLVSDASYASSSAGRSPHNGPSPIELPPLASSHSDRRHSAGSGLRLSVPSSFSDVDFSQPPLPAKYASHMLQDPFQPQPQPQPHHLQQQQQQQQQQQHDHHQHQQQQQYQNHQHQQQQQHFPQPAHYLPSQPAETMPTQSSQQFAMPPNPLLRGSYPPQYAQSSMVQGVPHQTLQLPSIANLAMSDALYAPMPVDPALGQMRTPMLPASTPDDSPRDKMSLSNLTH
ncbi:hypothetical protein LTR97_005224 [Elasticomyces elasticus]|uniref:Uncharacterized protein n=1 Tax=Elasticomyces elasticus TaxID=574655 RepID=A0AAN7WBU8_9PEZI|nr:hypothetical protein LTR97_005224 [Elasticomyces elasticus]